MEKRPQGGQEKTEMCADRKDELQHGSRGVTQERKIKKGEKSHIKKR